MLTLSYCSAGDLEITWMTQDPTPRAIRALVTCGCKTGCKTHHRCKCRKSGLQCSDVCKYPVAQCSSRAKHQQQQHGSSAQSESIDAPSADLTTPEALNAQLLPEDSEATETDDSGSGADDDSSNSSMSDTESSGDDYQDSDVS